MEKYIQQLLQEIESIILIRWKELPPHFYTAGVQDPYLIPPKNWKEEDADHMINHDSSLRHELSMGEMEKWLEGKAEHSMFSSFGLEPQQFPPPDKLSKEQLEALVTKILRLWASFNLAATIPDGTPSHIVYPILVKRMLEPATIMKFGLSGIEFCHYEPDECPFGLEYCSCKKYHDDELPL